MNISASSFKFPSRFFSLVILLLSGHVLLLSGCATDSAMMASQVEQQASDQQVIQQVMNALEVSEARYAKAQASNVETYAPRQMSDAESALREARRYSERFQDNPDLVNKSMSLLFGETLGQQTLALIEQANDALTQAEENKQQADTIFAEVNENFVWLNKFQARTYFRDEYKDQERAHQRLIDEVANGDLIAAREGLPRLLAEQHALEIAAAQRFYLHDITHRIEREGRMVMDRYAPLSYSSAVSALSKAKTVVAKNPRDETTIQAAKKNAEFALEIANAVATDMQRLVGMDRREMEQWLILLTTKLHDVGQRVGAQDVRNHVLVQQLDLLAQAAANSQPESQSPATVADVAPAPTPATAVKAEVPVAAPETIDHRMTQLEQSLGAQMKVLLEQINAMKAANVNGNTPTSATSGPEVIGSGN